MSTPLHEAALSGDLDRARELLETGGYCNNVNYRGYYGQTPLHNACRRGHLHSACAGGCVALVRTLLHDHNADVNAQDNDNNTPLHVAAANGKEDVALALINEFGCDTNIRGSEYGRTVLHSACEGGCVALVKTLIRDHNADVNAQDDDNNTPLHYAAANGKKMLHWL